MDNFRGDSWVLPAVKQVTPGPFTRLVEVVDKTEKIGLRTITLEKNSELQETATKQLEQRLAQVNARVDASTTRLEQRLSDHDQLLQALLKANDTLREAITHLEGRVADLERSSQELAQKLADAEVRLGQQMESHASSLADHESRLHALELWCSHAGTAAAKPRK